MVDALAVAAIVAGLVLAAWSFALVALSRGPQVSLLVGLVGLELLLLAQTAVALARILDGQGPDDAAMFLSYLATAVLAVPAGALWALTDRSRYGPAVLGVACLVVPALVVRLQQLWDGIGA